ncbi:MAG: TolC family protein [Vicinamibacterales bacterium]|nr:TolC family protein [Vicinamibacterales bacterium]
MRHEKRFLTRTLMASLVAVGLSGFGAEPVRAQTPGASQGPVRHLTIDEAVTLALEQNLDLQVERINPQVQDVSISLARTGWVPTFQSTLQNQTQNSPSDSFLAGSDAKITDERLTTNFGVGQLLPWGGSYNVSWNSGRAETNNEFSTFNPRLSSTFAFNYTQPLLRNFSIDNTRQQILVTRKNREISEVQLQQVIAVTTRNVKNAYWDLVYANSNLDVQNQSLRLAEQSLKDNRARVEVGTMAPIDIVQAEAEVAQREEGVILAEAAIQRAEDRLRALISNPSAPDFWSMRIEPADEATFVPVIVDVDAAVRGALDQRTDLEQSRKRIESNDVSIRYFRNQSLPDVNAQVNYSAIGLGGTQLQFGPGFPPQVVGQSQRSFGSVLGDAFGNAFPTWSFALQVSYPIGTSNADANLARARLQNQQAQKQLESQELTVATQIRDFARSVQTNSKRVEATRASRSLAERRLEAEEKKFQAGMTTSFLVFQAQRDLNQARNNELQALIDYLKSVVDYETAQRAPIGGAGGVTAVQAGGQQQQ